MAADWTMKKNDLLPLFEVILEDVDGPVDLSGASSAKLKAILKDDMGSTPKIDAVVAIDSDQVANKGKVKYTWVDGDTDTKGVLLAEVEVLYGSKPLTFPNDSYYIISIVDDVDANV